MRLNVILTFWKVSGSIAASMIKITHGKPGIIFDTSDRYIPIWERCSPPGSPTKMNIPMKQDTGLMTHFVNQDLFMDVILIGKVVAA